MFLQMAMLKHKANKSKIHPGNSVFPLAWKFFSLQLCVLCLLAGTRTATEKRSDAAPDLFSDLRVHKIQIKIEETDISDLRSSPRKYVPASIVCDGTEFHNVGIHLKGSVGSFRPIDDKPALTLNFAKFDKAQRIRGVRKV